MSSGIKGTVSGNIVRSMSQQYGPDSISQPGANFPPPSPGQPNYAAQPGYQPSPQPAAPPPQRPGQAYPQPYQPPMPQPYPVAYGAPVYAATPPREPRNPALGIISLLIVLVATAFCLVGAWSFSNVIAEAARASYYYDELSSLEIQRMMTGPITTIAVASTVGFGGWIAAIVAAATRRGRGLAITAIIIGVMAPIITGGYLAVLLSMLVNNY